MSALRHIFNRLEKMRAVSDARKESNDGDFEDDSGRTWLELNINIYKNTPSQSYMFRNFDGSIIRVTIHRKETNEY